MRSRGSAAEEWSWTPRWSPSSWAAGAETPREREVLELMAEGHTNAGIARRLVVSEGAVEKHNQRIFAKLGLHANGDVHRRVSAVLTLLGA